MSVPTLPYDAAVGAETEGRGVHYDLASGTFNGGEGGRTEEQIVADYETAMARMRSEKALGNKLLADEQFGKALGHYEHAGTFLHTEEMMDVDLGNSDARRDELVEARLTLLLNMAQALLKIATEELMIGLEDAERTEKLEAAVERCDQALKLDGKSTKALYRRAAARENLGLLELAEEDLRAARELVPKDRQVRTALARVTLGARSARNEREAGFRGNLPPPKEPPPPSVAYRAVKCCQRWGPPALLSACGRCGANALGGLTLEAMVPAGVALLSVVYCVWKGLDSMDPDEYRSHAIALTGLVLGSFVWAYEARVGPIFGDGGFREGMFGDDDPRAAGPDLHRDGGGNGGGGGGGQRQQTPKIKIMRKDGKVRFEYQAKPGEFQDIQFK